MLRQLCLNHLPHHLLHKVSSSVASLAINQSCFAIGFTNGAVEVIFRNNCELQIFQFWQNVQGTRCHKGRAVFQTTSSWQSSRIGVQSSVWWRELPHKVLFLDLRNSFYRLFSTRTVFGTKEDKNSRQGQELYITKRNFHSFDFYRTQVRS